MIYYWDGPQKAVVLGHSVMDWQVINRILKSIAMMRMLEENGEREIKKRKSVIMGSTFLCSVQSLSCVRLFATPWIAARQASLSITNSRSSLRLTSIESVIPSSHLILCCPLLLPPIPPSIRVFSNESTFCMRWPKYWSFLVVNRNI